MEWKLKNLAQNYWRVEYFEHKAADCVVAFLKLSVCQVARRLIDLCKESSKFGRENIFVGSSQPYNTQACIVSRVQGCERVLQEGSLALR